MLQASPGGIFSAIALELGGLEGFNNDTVKGNSLGKGDGGIEQFPCYLLPVAFFPPVAFLN
jgi:hypothetical protein